MSNHQDFVVYAYSREKEDRFGRKGTFYYVGKGKPNRPYENKRRVKRPKGVDRIHILHKNLDNKTAVECEKKLILLYGREDIYPEWGILLNLTDGGEGTIGYTFTDLHRENISKANKGRKRSEEQKRFLSESRRGKDNPMYGKPSPVRGNKHRLYMPLNWFHPVCGEVYNKSACDLVRMFPEQLLLKGALCNVRKGVFSNHKGWRPLCCPIDGDISTGGRDKFRRGYRPLNWFHPDVGEVFNKSPSEIKKLFPRHKVSIGNLLKVSKGIIFQHGGWRALCCPITP
jgi:hypothetical protein